MHSYRDDDLPRLQDTLAEWIQRAGACGYYHPGNIAHRIYEGFSGRIPRHDLVHLWEEADEIIGFTYSFVFDAAFFAFVAPHHRGSAVELELLRTAMSTTERYMAETNQDEQTEFPPLITDVYNCDQIRIDLLTQLGFEHYRTWDWITERSLAEPVPEPVLPAGFTVRTATPDDADGLAAIRNNAFGGSWTGAVYHNQVMCSPGYDPAHELIVVAPDGRIAAFTVIRFDDLNKVGLFEPVGTHSEFRRLGLARAMMLYALQAMQHRGLKRAMVEHTADNAPARELYRSLGFHKRFETWGFQRPSTT
ncbi:MAG: GNAT family N-acetyltransferase [Caldilineaceae bacterium]|nr:GNAT family N-acetyltransferase [Caldilineaceae bacterium]